MTESDILSLPAGREMDTLVASQVMGGHFDGDTLTDGKRCWPVPLYSASIAAAWDVVERLLSLPAPAYDDDDPSDVWHRTPAFTVARRGGGWRAGLVVWDVESFWASVYRGCEERPRYADAETAPLAICRAALLIAKG